LRAVVNFINYDKLVTVFIFNVVSKEKIMKLIIVLFSFLIMGAGMPAYAATYGFSSITTNGAYYDDVAPHLSVDVTDVGGGNVLFTFENSSPSSISGSITDIYFSTNDPVYFNSIVSIDNTDAGVSFTAGATPGNLPSGNTYDWGFSADSDAPALSANGVEAGESLGITLELAGINTFNSIIESLGVEGGFFIGLHVQSLFDGESNSFVSNPADDDGGEGGSGVVPIPAAIWLFGSALIGLMGVSRKQKAMTA